MPGMDGFRNTGRNQKRKQSSILMFTSKNDSVIESYAGLRMGADDDQTKTLEHGRIQ